MTAAGAAFLCFRMISFSKRDNASLRRLFTQDMDANDGSGSCILILSTQNTVPPGLHKLVLRRFSKTHAAL